MNACRCFPRGIASKAEEGVSATSVSAGSLCQASPWAGETRKLSLRRESGWWGHPDVYLQERSRTTGYLTREGLEIPVDVESHFDLFG